MGGKRTFPAYGSISFCLATTPALYAALTVDDGKSKRVFEAVNFVDDAPVILPFNKLVGPDDLTAVSRRTDCICKIAEAHVAMRLH